jgi:cell division protein ZipA
MSTMSDANLFRIILAVAGLLWLAYIWWSGSRKPPQGTRTASARRAGGERVEPTLGDLEVPDDGLDPALRAELDGLSSAIADHRTVPEPELPLRQRPGVGLRADQPVDRIVTLHVSARPGTTIGGPELVIALEKAGLEFGDQEIFHRMDDARPDAGPVYSVANMVKPGSFDMRSIGTLRTPGLTFFMTLPGPMPALDAWETMLPAAQRCAELLDAEVLDEHRNALGRQTVQHIRDELRAFDRKRDKQVIRKSW